MTWQPMETAPKDGTPILCLVPAPMCGWAVLRWCYIWVGYGRPEQYRVDVGWELAIDGDTHPTIMKIEPSGWRPLPT
jgi:hypothetical protein